MLTRLAALWWTCWLLSGLSFGVAEMSANWGIVPHMAAHTNGASLGFLVISGATLIVIIRTVSDRRVGSEPVSYA